VLTFQAQSELEVVKWILSFGREAELLRPAHLRERVREELADALGYYSLREAQSEVS
jgi:predicted DNA-binding transcriptional regulator YafY